MKRRRTLGPLHTSDRVNGKWLNWHWIKWLNWHWIKVKLALDKRSMVEMALDKMVKVALDKGLMVKMALVNVAGPDGSS